MKPTLTREQWKAFGQEVRDLNKEFKMKRVKLQAEHIKDESIFDASIEICELEIWYLKRKYDIYNKYNKYIANLK